MYRIRNGQVQVFLVHLAGPLFVRKWNGYWSIPKGLLEDDEDPMQAAIREFEEETGLKPESDNFINLGTVRHKSGRLVHVWAFEGEWPQGRPFVSNLFTMEWPPGSGRLQQFPEVELGQFFSLADARIKMNARQIPLLDRLLTHLGM
jgi:predicted NUDIX family NTP pyrophosphohydrolase